MNLKSEKLLINKIEGSILQQNNHSTMSAKIEHLQNSTILEKAPNTMIPSNQNEN